MSYPEIERFVMKQWSHFVHEANTQQHKDFLAINFESNQQEHPWTVGTLLGKYQQAELDTKEKIIRKLAYLWRDAIVIRRGAMVALDVPMIMQHVRNAAGGGLGAVQHSADLFLKRRGVPEQEAATLSKKFHEAAERRIQDIIGDVGFYLEVEHQRGGMAAAKQREEDAKKGVVTEIHTIERIIERTVAEFIEPTTLRVSSTTLLRWIRDNYGREFEPSLVVIPLDWTTKMVWAQLDTLCQEKFIFGQPPQRADDIGTRNYVLTGKGGSYLKAVENVEGATGTYLYTAVQQPEIVSYEAQTIWEATPWWKKMHGRLLELKARHGEKVVRFLKDWRNHVILIILTEVFLLLTTGHELAWWVAHYVGKSSH